MDFLQIHENVRWPVYYSILKSFTRQVTVLETGRIRGMDHVFFLGDGWSTLFWAIQAQVTHIVSIDIDKVTQYKSQTVLGGYGDVEYINKDSLEAMRQILERGEKFDIILLDSLDDTQHNLNELSLAIHMIRDDGVIVLDDVYRKSQASYIYLIERLEVLDRTASTVAFKVNAEFLEKAKAEKNIKVTI